MFETYNDLTIYGLSTTGKSKIWKAHSDLIVGADTFITITIQYGYEDGKQQTKTRIIKSGKNIGKKNETTIEDQAKLALIRLYQEQLDGGYVLLVDKAKLGTSTTVVIQKPMLAHKYADKKHLLKVDAIGMFINEYFAQPKLNGIRCFVTKLDDTTLAFTSRSGKPFVYLQYIAKDLVTFMSIGDILDGELFNKDIAFEHITTLVNSESDKTAYDSEGNVKHHEVELQYHIYDYIKAGTDLPFKDRIKWIDTIVETDHIKTVETVNVTSTKEIERYFKTWMLLGYEGLMLRTADGMYKFNYRSTDLLKYKEMLDAEYKILEIYIAENDPLKVIFTCEVSPGQTFNCALKGDKQLNYDTYYLKREEYIGQYLTVQFQALTIYGIPQFPVGLNIRAGEVVDGQFIPSV